MNERYDAVVIGSGCGGAAAAALASRLGLKTLLLEKNRFVGGKASTYEREGFKLDHGHIIMRCEKGPHGEVLRLARCDDLIPRFSHCTFWPTISTVAGVPVKFVPNFWYQVLTPGFLRQFSAYGLTPLQKIQLAGFCLSVFLMPSRMIDALDHVDIHSFLRRYTSCEFAHSFFGGLATVGFGALNAESSAGELIRVMHAGIWDVFNIGYPVTGEGISAIPKSFLRAARRLGCDIRTHVPVDRIVVDKGRVTGVVLNGERISAPCVISNAGLKETVHKLVGPEHFDAGYLRWVDNLKYSYGGISLKYALDRPVTRYYWGGDIPGQLDRVAEDMMSGRIPHRFPTMFVVPSNIDRALAPRGKQVLSVISGGPAVEPGKIDWNEWVQALRTQVEGSFPGIREHSLFCDVSTPDDIANATGRFTGDAVGVAQTIDQVGARRPSPISPLPGLYYVGADVGRGQFATELASQSAIDLYHHLQAKGLGTPSVPKALNPVREIYELAETCARRREAEKPPRTGARIEGVRQIGSPSKAPPLWDVIVIGTGMGGSAAGAICALHGLKTLILEKNARPGGACSYYEKQGFRMDTGTHLFIRGNKGPFGTLTRRLGMGHPIDFRETAKTVQVKAINVDAVVPKNVIGRMIAGPRILRQIGIHPIHYPAILRLFLEIALMSPRRIEALDHTTIEEFMFCYTGNAEVRAMVGGLLGLFFILPPWEASAGESIWNLQKLLWEGNLRYPKGGASIIPMTFLQGARNHGAAIRLNAGVKGIDVTNGRVGGVITADGEHLSTRALISTTSAHDTVFRLAGEEHFPGPYADRIRGLKPSWTAVQAKIAVKKRLIKAGSLIGGIPLKFSGVFDDAFVRSAIHLLEAGTQGDLIPIYAPVPTNFDPDLAPKGCQIITAVAVAPTLDVPLREGQDVWIRGMMGALQQMIPNLQENTIFSDTWSVAALASWIGKSNGSAISTGQRADQVRTRRPGHHTPVKGLYLAGDCAGMARGVGTELACQSGMDCADLVAQDLASCLI